MPTQVYLGEELEAREATNEEKILLLRRTQLKREAKKAYEEIAEIDNKLPQRVALVADIPEEGSASVVTRTHIIDKPKGHFVQYKDLDLVMDAKTTKKLLKEFNRD